MQQCLKMLEEGPWQYSRRSLDDYPVGTVFHLSQQFGAIAGPFLRTAGEPCRENTSAQSPSSDGTAVDMPTTLLILSSYISLTRI
jgi:hypothetical protein